MSCAHAQWSVYMHVFALWNTICQEVDLPHILGHESNQSGLKASQPVVC
jgi:hypothetical protein